jgi:hypothetical protein
LIKLSSYALLESLGFNAIIGESCKIGCFKISPQKAALGFYMLFAAINSPKALAFALKRLP